MGIRERQVQTLPSQEQTNSPPQIEDKREQRKLNETMGPMSQTLKNKMGNLLGQQVVLEQQRGGPQVTAIVGQRYSRSLSKELAL